MLFHWSLFKNSNLKFKLDEQIEDLFKSKRSLKDKTEAAGVTVTAPGNLPSNIVSLATSIVASAQASVADKLKMAKGIADRVSANKNANKDNVDQLARSILGGTAINTNLSVRLILIFLNNYLWLF